jgi:hypothetical protein
MDFRFSNYFVFNDARSAVEAWHSVPLISINLPFLGFLFRVNNWLLAVALAVVILSGNH